MRKIKVTATADSVSGRRGQYEIFEFFREDQRRLSFLQAKILRLRVEYFTIPVANDCARRREASADAADASMLLDIFFDINRFDHLRWKILDIHGCDRTRPVQTLFRVSQSSPETEASISARNANGTVPTNALREWLFNVSETGWAAFADSIFGGNSNDTDRPVCWIRGPFLRNHWKWVVAVRPGI